MYLKTCKKGEILFRQGDVEEWMYYIHQGKVGIFIAYGTENEQKVEELFSDQFVGDMVVKTCSYACIPTSDIVIYKKGSENEALVKDCMDSLTEFSEKMLTNSNK